MRPVFAIESNADAFATYRHNLIDGSLSPIKHSWPTEWLPVGPHNIRSIRRRKEKYSRHLKALRAQVDLVAGGPPCQGFSSLGRRNSRDPRNLLVHDYLWFVRQIQPRFILLENVAGMAADFNVSADGKPRSGPRKSGASKLLEGLKADYLIATAEIFRASDYGVPQRRPRFIAIAVHRDSALPSLSDDDLQALAQGLHRKCRARFLRSKGLTQNERVSCADAISDLETSTNDIVDYDERGRFKRIVYKGPRTKYQKEMHGQLNGITPDSLRLPNHTREIRARFEFIHGLASKGEIAAGRNICREILTDAGVSKHIFAILDRSTPARTISTLPDDYLHYSEPRILTVRENARLQSFPDWFEFKGKYTTGGSRRKKECPRYTQVGNAVAPRFAEYLGQFLVSLDKEICQR